MSNRVGQVYVCAVCGNEVEFKKDSGAQIICCGEAMTKKQDGSEE